ncbi:MAG TPA: sigma-70 family RNA polymerase sigma factor [Candidatus Binatia bacterium]|jgi:RNA polymerase sigma factor (sigma-70 family)|nr:sigma-70 family RNA polymerase sigma factor [Candidatus Binatia bacterium]
MTQREKNLLAGCIRGDKASWDAFVLQYSALVYHTIRKTFVTFHAETKSDLVDDLFQEFFLAIVRDDFKKLRQFRGDTGCSLASWLRVVAARMTIDFLRKQGSSKSEPNPQTVPNDDPAASLIIREEERALGDAVKSLSSRDQIFLDLCFVRALPPEDIAAILKTSVNAVYTQKSRILEKKSARRKKSQSLPSILANNPPTSPILGPSLRVEVRKCFLGIKERYEDTTETVTKGGLHDI